MSPGRPPGSPAPGFDPTRAGPSEILAEALRRLEGEAYAAAAELYHERFVARCVRDSWQEVRPEADRRPPTVDGLLEMYPEMPREAAEWEVRQHRNRPPPPPDFTALDGIDSAEDLEALRPVEVLARRLRAADHRHRFRAYLERLAGEYPQYADQLEAQSDDTRYLWGGRVLGEVVHPQAAFVVLGPEAEIDPEPDVPSDDGLARLVVLRPSPEGWRISSSWGLSDGLIVHFHVTVQDEDGRWIVLS